MFMFVVVTALVALGLGWLIRKFITHWIGYIIAVVLGPVVGVLMAVGASLLEAGDDPDRMSRMIGQGFWIGLIFAVIGVIMFRNKPAKLKNSNPEYRGEKVDPWHSDRP